MRWTTFLVYISKTCRDILFRRQLVSTRHKGWRAAVRHASNNWHCKSHLNADVTRDAVQWYLVIIGLLLTVFNKICPSLDQLRGLGLVNTQPLWCTWYLHAIDTIVASCIDIAEVMPSDGIPSLAWLVLPYMPPATGSKLVRLSLSYHTIRIGSAFHLNGECMQACKSNHCDWAVVQVLQHQCLALGLTWSGKEVRTDL